MSKELKYPATQTVHCPSGATNACDKHADGVHKLFSFLGVHVVSTALLEDVECDNCVNENQRA